MSNPFSFRAVPVTYELAEEDHKPKEPVWMDLSNPEKVLHMQSWVMRWRQQTDPITQP
jgi:hypothetical protein